MLLEMQYLPQHCVLPNGRDNLSVQLEMLYHACLLCTVLSKILSNSGWLIPLKLSGIFMSTMSGDLQHCAGMM